MKKFPKKVKAPTTTWGHHDNMIVNLRDWVKREVDMLRNDIAKEVPELNSSTSKLLKSAEDANAHLFDLIRSVVELAEKEAKKKKPVAEVVEEESEEDELVVE